MSSTLFGFLEQGLCLRLTQALFHFIWQGFAVALCAFVIARICRTASANVRYGIYAVSLGLMSLSFPLTFLLLPSGNLPPADRMNDVTATNPQPTTPPADRSNPLSPDIISADNAMPASEMVLFESEKVRPDLSQTPQSMDVKPLGFIEKWQIASIVERLAPYTVMIYFAGLMVMMTRLCFALWGGHRLRRAAVSIDNPRMLERVRSQATQIGLRIIPVVAYCERIAIPVVAGIVRPVVLLPIWMATEMDPEQVLVIIAHEMAHIRRFDLFVNLLQRVLETFLFFHPAVWYVSRQLSFERENCCDDAVVRAGHGNLQYASTLVRLAELCAKRHPALATAMLATLAATGGNSSQLKLRIMRLLNSQHRLRLTRTDSFTIVLMAGLITLAVTGLLRQVIAAPQDTPAATAPSQTNDGADGKKIEFDYVGKVVDSDGKPIEGAEIWCTTNTRRLVGETLDQTVRQVATSDRNGDFAFKLDTLEQVGLDSTWWNIGRVAARADGYAADWLPLPAFEKHPIATTERDQFQKKVDSLLGEGRFSGRALKLPRETGPVHGRLLDLEGRPLAGVVISAESIHNMDFAEVTASFEKNSSIAIRRCLDKRTPPGGWLTRQDSRALIHSVKTNENGEFFLRGVGPDQVVSVTLSHERVASEQIYIVGREMEMRRVAHIDAYPNGAKDVYVGTDFTLAVGPAIPISGVITEFQSGKPIANATVVVERLFGRESQNSNVQLRLIRHIRTVTDANGRYELVGVPPGENHTLEVYPPTSEPWLLAQQEFSLDSSETNAIVNVQAFRGIWLEGRITDASTGKPINGRVDYLALRSNPNTPAQFGLREGWMFERFRIDETGRYRTAGLPGPGLILVRSYEPTPYPLCVGVEKVIGYNAKNDSIPTSPVGVPLSNWNRIEQIDPAKDATSHSLDLTLSARPSLTGRVLGPDGSSVKNLRALGQMQRDSFLDSLTDATFKIHDYDPEIPRSVFVKSSDNSLIGNIQVKGTPPDDLVIHLQPAVTVQGRLIETETDDIAIGYSLYCDSSKLGQFRIDDDTKTNKEGRFEIKGLLAGNTYKMSSSNVRRFDNGKNNFSIDLTNANPGDVIDLGDVTGKNAKMTK